MLMDEDIQKALDAWKLKRDKFIVCHVPGAIIPGEDPMEILCK